ncbi:MAG: MFS transporter [Verrucomicrobia bacterium]|nr:MFS transporter [Verrucomicrobiota bacterium]
MSEPAARLSNRALVALVAGSLILTISVGLRQSFGLFVGPMSVDLGLTAGAVGFAVAMQQLVWGASQPFAGMLADRFGLRLVLVAGGLLYAAGLAVLAGSNGAGSLRLGFGVLIGLGLSGGGFSIIFSAVAREVPTAWRSTASGIAGAGGSVGQFIFAPTGQFFIETWGWPTALAIYAAIALLTVPLGLVLAPASHPVHAGGPADVSLGDSIRTALRTPSYQLLNAGFFVCGFHIAFVATYLPGSAVACGLPSVVGAQALGIIGLANILGSTTAGILGARYPLKYLLSSIYFIRSAAIAAFLLLPKSRPLFLVFAAVLGFTWLGTVPLTSGVVATLFGPRFLASLFGLVFFSHQVGAFFGAWLGGFFFDRTGSYDAVWLLGLSLSFVAGLLHLPIRERPVAVAATG